MLRTLLVILSLGITTTAWPGELISDPDSVRGIFSGKTAYGKHLKKNKPGHNVYFAPDGTSKRFTEAGEHQTGKWHVNDQAQQCIEWDHNAGVRYCRAVMAGFADDVYFRIKQKGNKRIKVFKYNDFRDGDQVSKP